VITNKGLQGFNKKISAFVVIREYIYFYLSENDKYGFKVFEG
jgi:hypothetical protein